MRFKDNEFIPYKLADGRILAYLDPGSKSIFINCLFGLSLFWEYCCIFNQFNLINFNISLPENYLTEMRSLKYYRLMKEVLIEQIDGFSNVVFLDKLHHDCIMPTELLNLCQNIYSDFFPNLIYSPKEIFYPNCKEYPSTLPDKYIVINTKMILNSEILHWEKNKQILIDIIKNAGIPIVLIGEKQPMECKEYKIHGSPSIYKELLLSFDNVIDFTLETTEDLYDMGIMHRNMYILNNSLFNIHFGGGGGRIVFAFLNHTISLSSDTPSMSHKFWSSKYENVQTTDSKVFSDFLKKFL